MRIGRYILHLAMRHRAPRVVIVDPNLDAAGEVGEQLERHGCAVVAVTSNPDRAFSAARRRRATVVITDIVLPDGHGGRLLEVGKQLLRSLQLLQPPPQVIVRTAMTTSAARRLATEAGARIVVALDIGPATLAAEVQAAHRAYLAAAGGEA